MGRGVVVMGVSGSGKSTVAAALGEALGLRCIDGDDLHAAASVEKMRRGVPLSDDDRWPWLERIGAELAQCMPGTNGTVVACSALRRNYRERLRRACAGLRFVFLHGDTALIEQRMASRAGHYMPATLLASQLRTLEAPGPDEADVLPLDIAHPPQALAQAACSWLLGETNTPATTPPMTPRTTP